MIATLTQVVDTKQIHYYQSEKQIDSDFLFNAFAIHGHPAMKNWELFRFQNSFKPLFFC